jgi:hypothetical protein
MLLAVCVGDHRWYSYSKLVAEQTRIVSNSTARKHSNDRGKDAASQQQPMQQLRMNDGSIAFEAVVQWRRCAVLKSTNRANS